MGRLYFMGYVLGEMRHVSFFCLSCGYREIEQK